MSRVAPLGHRLLSASLTLVGVTMATRAVAEMPTPAVVPPIDVTRPTRTVTLPEAVGYAREHQPAIHAALARVAARVAEASIPTGRWLPTVGVSAQIFGMTANNTTGTYLQTSSLDIPRIGATPAATQSSAGLAPYPSTFVGAGILQEVFDFGRIAAQRAAADALVTAERHRADADRLDVDLGVGEAYFAVLAAKAVVTASDQAYERSRVHRDLAKRGVESGLRSPIELTRAEADLARFDVDRVRAQGALTSSEAVLAAAIGAPDPAIDAGVDDVAYAAQPGLDAAIRELDQRDPSLRAATDVLHGQQQLTRAIEAERRPDLSFVAGLTGRAGGSAVATNPTPDGGGWIPSVPNWDAMIMLTWPFFDRTVDVRAETSRRLEHVRAAELDAQRERLRGGVAQVYVDFQVSQSAVPALERSRDAARANQDQADARFKSGLATAVELADAEALLTDAEIQLAIGQFHLARARARLARVIAQEVP